MIEKYYIINLYMSFQSTVLKIATVIYCIFLISIILLMVGSSRSIKYPPGVSVCPDYWKTNKDGSCSNSTSGSITLGSLASGCKTDFQLLNFLDQLV